MSETRTSAPQGSASGDSGRVGLIARVSLFVRQVVAELRKVVWPTRSQLITYTIVVLVFVVGMMAIVGVLDFAFSQLVLRVFGGA